MRTLLAGLILTFSIFLIFSCQREVIEDSQVQNQNDSVYIKSLVILDSFVLSANDTAFKFFFDYDSQKRLNRLREFHYVSNTIDFTSDVRFSYSGNDTLPSVLYVYSIYSLPVYDTVYLSYNNGKIVKDSSAYGTPGSPKSFVKFDFLQVSNNLYTGSYIDSVFGFQASRTTLNSNVNWQNGNMVAEKDTIQYVSGPTYFQSKDYTYDQNPNPLRKAMLNFPTTGFYFNTTSMAHGNLYLKAFVNNSANNILTEIYNPGNELTTWVYTYGANGLPKISIRQRASRLRKVIYDYTSL